MMAEVLRLLESKNKCLQELLNCSEDFLSLPETEIESFQNRRELAFKAIHLYDQKIKCLIDEVSHSAIASEALSALRESLRKQEDLVQSILSYDQKVVAKIEEEKNRLLKELSTSDKASHLVRKFRSKWISESGEKLDGKL